MAFKSSRIQDVPEVSSSWLDHLACSLRVTMCHAWLLLQHIKNDHPNESSENLKSAQGKLANAANQTDMRIGFHGIIIDDTEYFARL
mmetsp:Transcript_39059/g.93531  ORF Transcript_39059/g.93531 Transcript_39059/m.93531 type:complete len:87 (+) Transcript_39059:462-722(+)